MVNSKHLDSVREYLAVHKNIIINDYQATGVGIGKLSPTDESYVIVVYLTDKSQMPSQPIIRDGITLKFEVTGQFVLHK